MDIESETDLNAVLVAVEEQVSTRKQVFLWNFESHSLNEVKVKFQPSVDYNKNWLVNSLLYSIFNCFFSYYTSFLYRLRNMAGTKGFFFCPAAVCPSVTLIRHIFKWLLYSKDWNETTYKCLYQYVRHVNPRFDPLTRVSRAGDVNIKNLPV